MMAVTNNRNKSRDMSTIAIITCVNVDLDYYIPAAPTKKIAGRSPVKKIAGASAVTDLAGQSRITTVRGVSPVVDISGASRVEEIE